MCFDCLSGSYFLQNFYHSSSTCEAGTTFGLKRHNVENVAV